MIPRETVEVGKTIQDRDGAGVCTGMTAEGSEGRGRWGGGQREIRFGDASRYSWLHNLGGPV